MDCFEKNQEAETDSQKSFLISDCSLHQSNVQPESVQFVFQEMELHIFRVLH